MSQTWRDCGIVEFEKRKGNSDRGQGKKIGQILDPTRLPVREVNGTWSKRMDPVFYELPQTHRPGEQISFK